VGHYASSGINGEHQVPSDGRYAFSQAIERRQSFLEAGVCVRAERQEDVAQTVLRSILNLSLALIVNREPREDMSDGTEILRIPR
jgi:hypothetical protein